MMLWIHLCINILLTVKKAWLAVIKTYLHYRNSRPFSDHSRVEENQHGETGNLLIGYCIKHY